ncbi:hypothetical protein OUZ56_008290 [Daphnia magna]|uniref:CxC3 like cysteine cluster domain-containing protein n=1 Tax=Daphnia magna TaxID=35525 RepID=A0ABR0ACM1_9CRUS|nr:hypothetical protein OUZ56_008290 [Daphnia magna]
MPTTTFKTDFLSKDWVVDVDGRESGEQAANTRKGRKQKRKQPLTLMELVDGESCFSCTNGFFLVSRLIDCQGCPVSHGCSGRPLMVAVCRSHLMELAYILHGCIGKLLRRQVEFVGLRLEIVGQVDL